MSESNAYSAAPSFHCRRMLSSLTFFEATADTSSTAPFPLKLTKIEGGHQQCEMEYLLVTNNSWGTHSHFKSGFFCVLRSVKSGGFVIFRSV